MPPTNGKLLGFFSVNCAVFMEKPALPGSAVNKESNGMEEAYLTDGI
jgi:hypothetical protein